MFTGPKLFFSTISIAGIWGDISVLGEAPDTNPTTAKRQSPPAQPLSAALRDLLERTFLLAAPAQLLRSGQNCTKAAGQDHAPPFPVIPVCFQ